MAAKGLRFHLAQESVFASELKQRVLRVYTERHDDKYGGRIPSKKRKAKMAILKITFIKRTDRCNLFSSRMWVVATALIHIGAFSPLSLSIIVCLSFQSPPSCNALFCGWCVCMCQTPSTGLRHPSFNHCRI